MVGTSACESDTALRQAVMSRLSRQPGLEEADIAVAADSGIVMLSGLVISSSEKAAAEHAAGEVLGVKAVASEIEVRPKPERSDLAIAKDALRALQANPFIPTERIRITVGKGRVTLEGIVPSGFHRLVSESLVKSLHGVTGVINNIAVVPQAESAPVKADLDETLYNGDAWAEIGSAEAG